VVDVQIKGIDELLKSLHVLPEQIQKNVLVGAIRAGATSISKEMKLLVPKDTGELQKSIGVVKRKSDNKNVVYFSVTPQVKKGGWIAHFLEFGTSKMSAQPFIRPAYERKGEETIEVAKIYMAKRIDKEIAKAKS
jgi:HK97 gp10 family phage protein